ncbi:MAG: phosphate ABC transporter permease subunit PstC [Deltaproteobacteria bacterium]|nr:phosphate ABC transporter permease subunit PstC [Deltaproteobacteria bacterium]
MAAQFLSQLKFKFARESSPDVFLESSIRGKQGWDKIWEKCLALISLFSVSIVFSIILFLVIEALPILSKVGFKELFFSDRWQPTSEVAGFGMLPLILGSIWVTVGALVLTVPLGIGCAIYLSEVAPIRMSLMLKPAIELLSAIPSVVYGFFGLVVVVPLAEKFFHLPVGQSIMVGSFILAIMALPTIISISEDALKSVPKSFREASLALGATRWHTISRVVVPAAFSGIATSVILGMGRAVGETMAVLMVTGNAAVIPHSFLEPVRTLTATIAAEMGETAQGGLHYQSLFLIGVLLLIITMILNGIASFIVQRVHQKNAV